MQPRKFDAAACRAAIVVGFKAATVRACSATRLSWRVTKATAAQAWQDRVLGLAAEAGFWALLSLTPLLLILISAVSVFGPHTTLLVRSKILHTSSRFLAPAAVNNILVPVLNDVTRHGAGGLLSVGSLFALVSGSTAMNTYVNTITIAYGMRGIRSAIRSRLMAFVLYLCSLVVGAITLPLLIIVPNWILAALPGPLQVTARPFLIFGYWPAVICVCTVAIASLYHFAVPVRGRWRRDLPGAFAAMVLWLACSFALRSYLSYAIGHSPTYGALAAPAAALLFLYVSSLALLFGAELNAQIGYMRTDTEGPAHANMVQLGHGPDLPPQGSHHLQHAPRADRAS